MTASVTELKTVVDKRAIGGAWQWNGEPQTPFNDVHFEHIDRRDGRKQYYCPKHGYSPVCVEIGCGVYEAPPTLVRVQGTYSPVQKGDWFLELPVAHGIYNTTIKVVTAKDFDLHYQEFVPTA